MNIMRGQIKRVFTDLEGLKTGGLWSIGLLWQGVYKQWHNNGQLYQIVIYKNGKREGVTKLWHTNGKLYRHAYYKNDLKDGEYKEWNGKGELINHKLYKDDKIIEDYLR